jgi:hypothetical protein
MSEVTRERRLEQVYGAKSNTELRALYDAWAGEYDQDLQGAGTSEIRRMLIGRELFEATG